MLLKVKKLSFTLHPIFAAKLFWLTQLFKCKTIFCINFIPLCKKDNACSSILKIHSGIKSGKKCYFWKESALFSYEIVSIGATSRSDFLAIEFFIICNYTIFQFYGHCEILSQKSIWCTISHGFDLRLLALLLLPLFLHPAALHCSRLISNICTNLSH